MITKRDLILRGSCFCGNFSISICIHYTTYIRHLCTMYNVHCAMYIIHSTSVYSIQYTMYTVCILYIHKVYLLMYMLTFPGYKTMKEIPIITAHTQIANDIFNFSLLG